MIQMNLYTKQKLTKNLASKLSYQKWKARFSSVQFSSFQSLSHVRFFATPWIAACQASLSITNSQSLLKLMSIESVMLSNHLILCCPLLLPLIFPSIRVFSNESVPQIRWPKYWSFSFNISPVQWIFKTDFCQYELVGSPCSPRNFQESSPKA